MRHWAYYTAWHDQIRALQGIQSESWCRYAQVWRCSTDEGREVVQAGWWKLLRLDNCWTATTIVHCWRTLEGLGWSGEAWTGTSRDCYSTVLVRDQELNAQAQAVPHQEPKGTSDERAIKTSLNLSLSISDFGYSLVSSTQVIWYLSQTWGGFGSGGNSGFGVVLSCDSKLIHMQVLTVHSELSALWASSKLPDMPVRSDLTCQFLRTVVRCAKQFRTRS